MFPFELVLFKLTTNRNIMEKKDLLTSDILDTFNEASKIDGHFCTENVDLGNSKFGIDIFSVIKKKTKAEKSICFYRDYTKKA